MKDSNIFDPDSNLLESNIFFYKYLFLKIFMDSSNLFPLDSNMFESIAFF